MDVVPPQVPVLEPNERRVLGVLLEKGLATPEYYPMTVNALVAGCNQKNNRDPVMELYEAAVVEALRSLERQGLALSIVAESGRVARWRQELGQKFGLNAVELAIVGELLLRGAQSEGELRGRASRMRPIETLDALREILTQLRAKQFVVRLSPESSARGVRWTHTLGPHEEPAGDERVAAPPSEARVAPPPTPDLIARIAALEERVARLERLNVPPAPPAPAPG